MNEVAEQAAKQAYNTMRTQGLVGSMEVVRPRTMRENIDWQIADLEARVERLRDLRNKLEAGTSLLDIDMNDLRQGMNY